MNVVETWKTYHWVEYLEYLIINICEGSQEEGTPIIFPSLIIWIAMYYIRPVGGPDFDEPNKIGMWNFKSFSMARNQQELEQAKFWLDTWFQKLKIKTTRWRVQ